MRKKLAEMDYRGILMLEVYPGDYGSYDDLMQNYDRVTEFFK